MHNIAERRKRGWRPRGQVCEACRKRCWGPGVGGGVWESWEKEEERRRQRTVFMGEEGAGSGKGKRPSVVDRSGGDGAREGEGSGSGKAGKLVLFACRHLWHRECLGTEDGAKDGGRLKCPLCGDRD